jgi:hypothetical protein
MLRNWLIFGFGVAGAALALTGAYAWEVRPDTYQDAVRQVLEQQHIAYTELEVRGICLPDPKCIINSNGTRTYATVAVRGSVVSSGHITCYDRRGDCYLDLPSLGIQRAPLRDLRGVRLLPKPLAQVWERGAAWVRGWLQPTPGS